MDNSSSILKVKLRYQQYSITIECAEEPQVKLVLEWMRGVALDLQRSSDKSLEYHITTGVLSDSYYRHILDNKMPVRK